MTFRVTWTIDLDADNPREAAELAQQMQRDPDTEATIYEVFEVIDSVHEIDLSEEK